MAKIMSGAVVEIGGTKTRIAWKFRTPLSFSRKEFKTFKKYGEAIADIVRFCKQEKITHVVIGVASPYLVKTGQLMNTVNLPDYRKRKPIEDLQKFGIHTTLANDLELSALGEARYGTGKADKTIAFIGIGTGAGAALVQDKKIIHGKYNLEAGHHILSIDNKKSTPGKVPGSFEDFISGSALRDRLGRDPAYLSDREFISLVPRLSQALINVSLFWSPDVIVLGGSVARRFRPFLPELRQMMRKSIRVVPAPRIAMAKLGEDAALAGGFAIASSRHVDPKTKLKK